MASGIYKRTMNRPSAANGGSQASPHGHSYSLATDAPDPDNAVHGAEVSTGRRVAYRTHAHSKTKKIGVLSLIVGLLLLGLIGVTMAWILAWAKLDLVEAEKLAMDATLRRTTQDLQQTRALLEQREKELSALVEERIPGLENLVVNQLIDVGDQYVQNITFFESGVADAKAIEYSVMLKNATEGMLLPQVRIFLFDELGRQAGLAKLKKGDAIASADLEELAPGESRSYHARIEVVRSAIPKYYLIDVR